MAVRELTAYTGRGKDEHRAIYVAVASTKKRDLTVAGIGFGVGALASLPLLPIVGFWAFLAIPVCAIIVWFLMAEQGGEKLTVTRVAAIEAGVSARTGKGIRTGKQVNSIVGRVLIAGEEPAEGNIAELIPLVIENPDWRPPADDAVNEPDSPFSTALDHDEPQQQPVLVIGHEQATE